MFSYEVDFPFRKCVVQVCATQIVTLGAVCEQLTAVCTLYWPCFSPATCATRQPQALVHTSDRNKGYATEYKHRITAQIFLHALCDSTTTDRSSSRLCSCWRASMRLLRSCSLSWKRDWASLQYKANDPNQEVSA